MKKIILVLSVSTLLIGAAAKMQAVIPPSGMIIRAVEPEGGRDMLQFWSTSCTVDSCPNGPDARFYATGDFSTHRSVKVSGSTINGTLPNSGQLPFMVGIQSDLAAGMPALVIEANISADLRQPLISGWGNGVNRVYVDSYGKEWLRGPDASLEISRSGGSGPLTLKYQGQPTTTGDDGQITDYDNYSNTNDLVSRIRTAAKVDNSGGQLVLYTKIPSGGLVEVARMSHNELKFSRLGGTGDTHVCTSSTGVFFRCP